MQQTERAYAGLFIAVDGGNGTGKSTLIQTLANLLRERGHDVLLTREPGGTPISEKIRAIILDPQNSKLCSSAELLLFAAARAQHFQEMIYPALASGKLVICDRFTASTIAFQGHARGIDLTMIAQANHLAIGHFEPDLNIVLDLDPRISIERMQSRGGLDRLDQQRLQFHQKARDGFLQQAREHNERFAVIDASHDPGHVAGQALAAVEQLIAVAQPTPRTLKSQESP